MSTSIGNIERVITLNGIDITKWVIDLPTLPNSKPDWGQIPSLPMLNIVVRSDDSFFHNTHPVSLIYQKRLDTLPLIVLQFGRVVWSGFLQDVISDFKNKRATLIGEASIQQKLNLTGRIDTTLFTPAKVARNLLVLHDIAVDEAAFSAADALLDDIPVRVQLNPSILEWTGTVADILQLLASAGVGRFYLNQAGEIGFDTYVVNSNPLQALEIFDDRIMQWPKITDESMEVMTGFSVKYMHGTESSSGEDNLATMDFGTESTVQVVTQSAAIYIGSQWVELSKRIYNRIEIAIIKELGWMILLGSFLRLNSVLLGIDRSLEVIGIDDGDARWVKITGRIDKGIT